MNSNLLSQSITTKILSKNNLGIIRYLLALTIILAHIEDLSGHDIDWPLSSSDGVKGFFIISGFLVGMSFMRSHDLKGYFSKRLKRLMPGYFGVIVFCLFLGTLLTYLPLHEFATNKETLRYLIANLLTLNFIEPTLPGIFEHNPIQAVNGSLWTTKVELMLYTLIPFVFLLCRRFNKGLAILSFYTLSFIYSEVCWFLYNQTGSSFYEMMNRQGFGQIRYFIAGTFLLFYFDKFIPKAPYLLPISICILLLRNIPLIGLLEPFALASLIIGAAYLIPYCRFLQETDNISYGMYLYHFPVIQWFVSINLYQDLLTGIFLTIVTTIILAICSWVIIEKRFLVSKQKKALSATTV